MKFHNRPRRRKIKRYRKIHTECAIVFKDSNDLINFVCNTRNKDVLNSSLYTCCGCYQLILSYSAMSFCKDKNVIFSDKLHINEIKTKSRLICKDDAILKMQKAFKVP